MKAGSSNPRRFSYEDLWETHPCQLWRNSLLEQKPNVSLREYECVCVCVCMCVRLCFRTPFHADVIRSFSWSANVCGRKKWLLVRAGMDC